jgi:hypothetical protein
MLYLIKSQDSSVGTPMGYRLDDRGSIPGQGKIFSLLRSVQTDSGAHSASYLMGTEGSFPRGPLTSIYCRGQKWRSYTTNPPYAFIAWCLIN